MWFKNDGKSITHIFLCHSCYNCLTPLKYLPICRKHTVFTWKTCILIALVTFISLGKICAHHSWNAKRLNEHWHMSQYTPWIMLEVRTSSCSVVVWISNYIHYNVWDEITYPFPNLNGSAVEVWEWMSNFILHLTGHVVTYKCWE